MCKTPCDDLRCGLYGGAIPHEGVCNPTSAKIDVEFIECCNTDLERRVNNIALGPMHIRVMNFCPPNVTPELMAGYFDPPQCNKCF